MSNERTYVWKEKRTGTVDLARELRRWKDGERHVLFEQVVAFNP